MQLADVATARSEASPRPSWAAIMTKAFALAARPYPRLRQAYFGFPWAHLCEYEFHTAGVVLDRRVGDEDVTFLAPLRRPEEQSLDALNGHLRRYKEQPVEKLPRSGRPWPSPGCRTPFGVCCCGWPSTCCRAAASATSVPSA